MAGLSSHTAWQPVVVLASFSLDFILRATAVVIVSLHVNVQDELVLCGSLCDTALFYPLRIPEAEVEEDD